MFDLLNLVQARCEEIFAGQLFDDPESGSGHQLRILQLGIQPKRESISSGQDYPFLVLRIMGGDDTPGSGLIGVQIIGGIYINPSADDLVLAAKNDMGRLLTGYRGLAADGNYSPYSLEKIAWTVGDKDGLHPAPDYYQVRAELTFSQHPIF